MKKLIGLSLFLSLLYHVDSLCMDSLCMAPRSGRFLSELELRRTSSRQEEDEKRLQEIKKDKKAKSNFPTQEEYDLLCKVRTLRDLTPQERVRIGLVEKK